MMAARGLAPLGPRDLVTGLYQLSLDADAPVAEAAAKSAGVSPSGPAGRARRRARRTGARLLRARLTGRPPHDRADPPQPRDPRRHLRPPRERLRRARARDHRRAEDRCLRSPAIVEALYFNKRCAHVHGRSAHRAVRPQRRRAREDPALQGTARDRAAAAETPAELQTPEVARWRTISSRAMRSGEESGGRLGRDRRGGGRAARGRRSLRPDAESIGSPSNRSRTSSSRQDRLATVGTAFHRRSSFRDSNKQVALAAARSPAVSDNEVVRYSGEPGALRDVNPLHSEPARLPESYR